MHVDTIESLFRNNRISFKEIINKIDKNIFNQKQSENKWSASEHFHHIYLVKKRITKMIRNIHEEIKNAGQIFITEMPVRESFGKITYDKMPDIPMPGTEPSNEFSKEQIYELMEDVYIEMDCYFNDCKKYNCSPVRAEHPFIGLMNYYEWLYFDGMHEKSHLDYIVSEYQKKE